MLTFEKVLKKQRTLQKMEQEQQMKDRCLQPSDS